MLHLDPQYAPLDFMLHMGPAFLSGIATFGMLWLGRLRDYLKGGPNGR